jgi:hypothetical protein
MVVLPVGLQRAKVPLQVRHNSIGPPRSLPAEEVDHCRDGTTAVAFYLVVLGVTRLPADTKWGRIEASRTPITIDPSPMTSLHGSIIFFVM